MTEESWNVYRQRTKHVRELRLWLQELASSGYLSMFDFPTPLLPSVETLYAKVDGPGLLILPRFLSPTLTELDLMFESPFPEQVDIATTLSAFSQLSFLSHLTIEFTDSTLDDASVLWLPLLLKALPNPASLEHFSLLGAASCCDTLTILAQLPNLRRLDLCSDTIQEGPAPRHAMHNFRALRTLCIQSESSVLALFLSHVQADSLLHLDIDLTASSPLDPFDISTIHQFTSIQSLDIMMPSNQTPMGLASLATLRNVNRLTLVTLDLDTFLTVNIVHTLVAAWPLMRLLKFIASRDVPPLADGLQDRPPPAFPLEGLRCIARHCPRLRTLQVAVNALGDEPQDHDQVSFPPGLGLCLAGSPSSNPASPHLTSFVKNLFPSLVKFVPGYPLSAWEDLIHFYKSS